MVIIPSIYDFIVHTSSSSMLRSIIFVLFNTNIVTILYFLVCILIENFSYYPVVVVLDLGRPISDTKQHNVGISVLVVDFLKFY